MFSFPGLNVVFLTGVSGEYLKVREKFYTISGGINKVA
jgi:hypothetical protein